MNKDDKYRPENIEKLLKTKSFDELLDSEKAYVLAYIDSREEYDEMRALLTGIESVALEEANTLSPGDDFRNNVLNEFDKRVAVTRGFWFSLNQLLAGIAMYVKNSFSKPVYRNPVLQYALAASVIVVGFFIIQNQIKKDNHVQLTYDKQQVNQEIEKPEEAATLGKKQIENINKTETQAVTEPNEVNKQIANEVDIPQEENILDDDLEVTVPVEDENEERAEFNEAGKTNNRTVTEEAVKNIDIQPVLVENEVYENKALRAAVKTKVDKAPAMVDNTLILKEVVKSMMPVSKDPEILKILFTTW